VGICFVFKFENMLATKYRLTGKDIQFLLRKGKKIYWKTFVFIVFKQYPQRSYMQRSVQIPVKLDKRAVMRNLLKRTAKNIFVKMSEKNSIPACKVFIFVNKKSLEPFKDIIATHKKTDIVQEWKKLCGDDFTLFFSRIWPALLNNSQLSWRKGKKFSSNWRRKNSTRKRS